MKKEMEIKLYKLEVIEGKEAVADEWLAFLAENKQTGEALLKKEKACLEAYFKSVENEKTYIYLFFAAEDVEFANKQAFNSDNQVDKRHFTYMQECIDLKRGDIMDCLLYLDNMGDFC